MSKTKQQIETMEDNVQTIKDNVEKTKRLACYTLVMAIATALFVIVNIWLHYDNKRDAVESQAVASVESPSPIELVNKAADDANTSIKHFIIQMVKLEGFKQVAQLQVTLHLLIID